MPNEFVYWILYAVEVLAVVIKSRIPKSKSSIRNYLGGALLLMGAAFAVGWVFDQTNPVDILLLNPSADIYSIFLISIGYGMVVRALLWTLSGAQPKESSETS